MLGARLGLLTGFLLAAVFSDVMSRKIPNRIILFGIIAGLLVQAFVSDGVGVLSALKGLFFGFGLFFLAYLLRVMGAGDVKLMAMVGCFTGSPAIFGVVLCTLLAGGVLSVIFSLKMKNLHRMLSNVKFIILMRSIGGNGNLALKNDEVDLVGNLPYAVAIAIGAATYLFLSDV